MAPMTGDRGGQVGEDVASLNATGLRNGEKACNGQLAVGAAIFQNSPCAPVALTNYVRSSP